MYDKAEIIALAIATIAVLYQVLMLIWFGYLAAIHLVHNKEKITTPAAVFAYPGAYFFYFVLDILVMNCIIGTILFLELPWINRLSFTARCTYHLREDTWRGRQARFWCRNFLDPFDNGNHCR